MRTTDPSRRRPVIEVLYVQECPHYPATLALVERVRFAGSPTVRVDGHDVEPGSDPATEYVLGCRLYRLEHRFAGQPEERWVREALRRVAGPG